MLPPLDARRSPLAARSLILDARWPDLRPGRAEDGRRQMRMSPNEALVERVAQVSAPKSAALLALGQSGA